MPSLPSDAAQPREFGDVDTLRQSIFDRALSSAQSIEPVKNDLHTLQLGDVQYAGPETYTKADQKHAILTGSSLTRRMVGTWSLIDNKTNKPVLQRQATLAHVPYLTASGTFVNRGVEYTLAHQLRLMPGIYTRQKDNGELESHVNTLPGKGRSHRYYLDPETGVFKIQIGQAQIPLAPLLRHMGVQDKDFREAWGNEITAANAKQGDAGTLDKLYGRLVYKTNPQADQLTKIKAIADEFNKTELDPGVMQQTLGAPYTRLTPEVILAATKKLIAVNRKEAESDDRDNMAFQSVHGPEDLIAERFVKDRATLRQLLWKATAKKTLDHIPAGVFNKGIAAALIGSGLGSCFDDKTLVLTRRGFIAWPDVTDADEFACDINGRLEYHRAYRIVRHKYTGLLLGCKTARLNYLVTPNHRLWCATKDFGAYRAERADEAHGGTRIFQTTLPPADSVDADFVISAAINNYSAARRTITIPGDAWAEFLGLYISAGWVSEEPAVSGKHCAKRRLRVCLAPAAVDSNYANIVRVLSALPFRWRYIASAKTFFITSKRLAAELLTYGEVHKEKRLPRYCFNWSGRRLRLFAETYLHAVEHAKIETTSSGLAYDLVELFGRLGRTGRINKRLPSGQNLHAAASYVVSFGSSAETRVANDDENKQRGRASAYYKQPYAGVVYCATVPGEKLYVMREGKPHWSLNSIEEINPSEIFDQQTRVTRLGEGGIGSLDAVPAESRNVQPSHFGFIDYLRTPESGKTGVDMRFASGARKSMNKLHTFVMPVVNNQMGTTEYKTPQELANMPLMFPGEDQHDLPMAAALVNGKMQYVPKSQIKYTLPNMDNTFAGLTNMVPMKYMVKGQRVVMGSRMFTQALPLLNPQAPLVQSARADDPETSHEDTLGEKLGAVKAQVAGRVLSVSADNIVVRDKDGNKHVIDLYNDLPCNRKSVTGDTEIVIKKASGQFYRGPIRNYAHSLGDQTLCVNPTTKVSSWHTVTDYLRHTNDKQLFKVTFLSGRSVTVTEDHSLITLDAHGQLTPIYPADCVVNKTRCPIAFIGSRIAPGEQFDSRELDFGRLIGLYLAQGHTRVDQPDTLVIYVPQGNQAEDVRQLILRLFPKSEPRRAGANITAKLPKLSKQLREYFGRAVQDKKIPAQMFSQSRAVLQGLVQGYLSGCGDVWADRNNTLQLTAYAPSQQLRDDLIAVLSALGIFATLNAEANTNIRNRRVGFGFRVISQHFHLLPRWFFYQDRHEEFCALQADSYRASPFEGVPITGPGRKAFYASVVKSRKPESLLVLGSRGYAHKRKLAQATGNYGAWGKSDVLWDTITNIQLAPHEEVVYDLSVDTAENFAVCNGLIVHNTFWTQKPTVQPGDAVAPGQLLATSNYTDPNGTAALGLNLRVAYLPFRGKNYEDASIISASAAKRLTSEHMYQHEAEWDSNTHAGKKAFVSLFPDEYDRNTLTNFDDRGAIKKGAVVNHGDPLILVAKKRDTVYGKVHRGRAGNFANDTVTWEHHSPGVVTDVAHTARGVSVIVKTQAEMDVGDKLTGRFGDKGVIAEIVPDDQMPKDKDGNPFEVLVSPLGLISRVNPAQVVEAALGKVAAKTGRAYKLKDFDNSQNLVEFAQKELAKHGLTDTEDVFDPETGRKISGVLTGNRFFMKLHHTAECYDEQTEVLTNRGWVFWRDVCETDEFATVDNGQLIYELPQALIKKHYAGPLFCFNGRAINYAVTPNHNMFVSGYNGQTDWDFKRADEVHGQSFCVQQFGFVPDTGHAAETITVGEHSIAWNDYAELVGWWAAAGYVRLTPRHACVLLYQSEIGDPEKCFIIETLLNRIGFKWAHYRVNGLIYGYAISSRALAEHLQDYGTRSHDKKIPRCLLDGSLSGRQRLFAAMMLGAGGPQETSAAQRTRFITTSKQLADDFQELAVRIGLGATVRRCAPSRETHYLPAWTCAVTLKRTTAQINGARHTADFSTIDYAGFVYCATMRTGLLYVRRDGKPMLCGNSKGQGRSMGTYTAEGTPAKGGSEGAKRVGMLELGALLSHGAGQVIRDAKMVRGQANPEYWSQFMAGYDPPLPKIPHVYEKFVNQLRASGINTVRSGDKTHIMAMTDKDALALAGDRELQNSETVDWKGNLKPKSGGLFDEYLTGGHRGNRWSKITLHEPMPNPVMEEPIRRTLGLTEKQLMNIIAGREKLNDKTGPQAIQSALANINVPRAIEQAREDIKSGRKTLRDAAVRRLGFLKAAEKTGVHPENWMMKVVPVLPPLFRPVSTMGSKKLPLVDDPNYLYKELFDANSALKESAGVLSDYGDERLGVYNSLKGVVGLGAPQQPKNVERNVQGFLAKIFGDSPKFGSIQRKLLSSTVDLVGRAVITPNPDLNMDEVALPEDKAWEIYKPFVVRGLVRRGLGRMQALQAVDEKTRTAYDELNTQMNAKPIVINRAPVLHRYGVMAFYPRLTKNKVMEINPVITKGFGADFDGDAMQYHVPSTDAAAKEAVEKMLPSKNLFATASFKAHYLPNKDYQTGLYLASSRINKKSPPRVFRSRQDAIAAYRRGEISVDTPVHIVEDK
ncbi:hypothetical protein EBZ39_01460 [bacterium]|nr:hypothetical protein [bacterium]